jgi:hypothetical protein
MRFSLRDLLARAAEMVERANAADRANANANDIGSDAAGESSALPASATAPAKLLNDVSYLYKIHSL